MRKYLLIGMVGLAAISCARWFDKDVTLEKTVLLSPPNGFSDSLLSKTFWWEEIEGVDEYQLQVVSPTFDSTIVLSLDTIVADVIYTTTLSPGNYEWRVRPVNDSYKGIWVKRTFTIEDTDNLSGQSITGALPANGTQSKSYAQTFTWNELVKADNYLFTVKNSSNVTLFTNVVSTPTASFTFTTDGIYKWSVQAQNDISASVALTQTIQIDSTKPTLPVLSYPGGISDTLSSFPVSFTYGAVTDNGTSITDTLLISTTNDFKTLSKSPIVGTGVTSLSVDTLSPGTYFWTIGRVDAVGNYGGRASAKEFVVK